ncbi:MULTISPECIES: LysR family transcriptional regulator [unclassified Streptomyces]|uniref:LysR family transcriptional regulator n=1 Tax=unclassified Streptomyces TaxID=2593676 RepID=UPI002E1CE80E|nr:LysR family transcriptional regulator [Streptomyces sp. NBC_01023]
MSNDLTVQQLRAFVMVAEELHFGRAAERLHMTQPPLTRHIQALEAAVGAPLLNRTSRRVVLTAAGAAFAVEARLILTQIHRAGDAARRISSGVAGAMAVGYLEPIAIDLLPRVLKEFRTAFPDVELELHELHTGEQIEALHARTIDCAIVRAPANADPDLEFATLFTDPLIAAMPLDHPLETDEIDLAALRDENFIVYSRDIGQGLIPATLTGCATAGFSPLVRREARSTPMLLTLVAAGEGVALVSRPIGAIPRPGVKFARLRGEPAGSEVLLAWRRGESTRALDRLRELLLELGRQPEGAQPEGHPEADGPRNRKPSVHSA